jgi:hypothetical protein
MNLSTFPDSLALLIGKRVRTTVAWAGIPQGTEGVIDEVYDNGQGMMVAWDLPDKPLPAEYCQYSGEWAVKTGIWRDGFSKTELGYLELV